MSGSTSQFVRGRAPARCGQGSQTLADEISGAAYIARFRPVITRPRCNITGKAPIFRRVLFKGYYTLTGITLDAGGAPLGNCTVNLFRTDNKEWIATTISDGSGNYSFTVGLDQGYYFCVGYQDGAPDVFGTTDDNLVLTAVNG